MKRIYIIVIALLFITFGCNDGNSPKTNIKEHTISISKVTDYDKSFKNLVKDFSFLELKVTNENYIAEVGKVIFFENKIYLLDRKKSNLFVFNQDGDLLRKIGSRGNGPGEYKDIIDFALNTSKKTISILSNKSIKVLEYDLDGNFINDIYLSTFFPLRFNLLDNKYYVFYTGYASDNYFDLIYTDLSGNIIKEDFSYPKDILDLGFAFTGGISNFGSTFLYSRSTSPVIYEINNSFETENIYSFDLGSKGWKEEDKFEFERFNNEMTKLEMAYLGNNYFINKDNFLFDYTDGRKIKRGYYNVSTKKLLTSDSFTKDGLSRIFNNYVGVDNKGRNICAYIPEYYSETSKYFKGLDESIENLDFELLNLFKNSDENSNQFLLFFNLSFE